MPGRKSPPPLSLSARKAAESARRQLAAIVESSDDAIIGKTLDAIITSWNRGAERLYGYRAEEVIGRPIAILVPPDRPDELPAIMERLRRGERVDRYDAERVAKDGRRLVVSVTISPVRGDAGEIVGASSVARDVSERRQEEAGIRFIAQASVLLAGSLDYEETLAQVAQSAVPELADWAAVDIVEADGSIRRLAIAHADPAKIVWARELERRFPMEPDATSGVPQVIRSGEPVFYPKIPRELLEGAATDDESRRILDELHLTSLITVPLQARGSTLGAITFVYAESERHYTEADLRITRGLALRAASAIDNARLYRDALAALHVRDEFLSAISHDLRTPLTTIRGLTQLALRRLERLGTAGSETVVAPLTRVDQAAEKMARMIDSLLDLSRLESGRPLDLDRQRMDLVSLVRELAEEHQRGAPAHQIRVEAARDRLEGVWDPVRLERVLANLLSNAVKYSPQGGSVALAAEVERDGSTGAAWATVSVQDEGIGIPAADLPAIFERFHRGSNVPADVRGVGIGLAGARQIVEQHGGTLTVESEERRGSRFTMRLPMLPVFMQEAEEA